jgi:hypothetical protein
MKECAIEDLTARALLSLRAMAAWGAGSFENDEAMGWVARVVASDGYGLVIRALGEAIEEEPLSVKTACEAIAAAEVVATAKGATPAKLPAELRDWITDNKATLSAELLVTAIDAVEAAAAEGSELRATWDGAIDRGAAFEAAANDLLARLRR